MMVMVIVIMMVMVMVIMIVMVMVIMMVMVVVRGNVHTFSSKGADMQDFIIEKEFRGIREGT
jgi:hypothetical protein